MKEILDQKRDYGGRDTIKENKVIATKYSAFNEPRRGEKMIDHTCKQFEALHKKQHIDY